MLTDITNAHKKARMTSICDRPHIIVLQNLVKAVTPAPKILFRPTSKKQTSSSKQCMGSKAKVINELTLPTPQHKVLYTPV